MNLAERVKELRIMKGFSQELLAEESGLSLRTIQRIEGNESVPRGDTLTRLAIALGASPDEIVDWKIEEDSNYLILMNLSTFGFLFFPLLGIIIPLTMWILKKDKLKHVNELGKSILNFQISWTSMLFLYYIFLLTGAVVKVFPNWNFNLSFLFIPLVLMYLYNIVLIIINTIRIYNNKPFVYKPAFKLLK